MALFSSMEMLKKQVARNWANVQEKQRQKEALSRAKFEMLQKGVSELQEALRISQMERQEMREHILALEKNGGSFFTVGSTRFVEGEGAGTEGTPLAL